MTWTYDATAIATTSLYQVRRLIGDVNAADQQLQDQEIAWEITQQPGNVYAAAAECCRLLAARYSRDVDTTEGDLHRMYSARQKAYADRGAELDIRSAKASGGVPYAGGISVADKAANVNNTDRVSPNFLVGMDDNWNPPTMDQVTRARW